MFLERFFLVHAQTSHWHAYTNSGTNQHVLNQYEIVLSAYLVVVMPAGVHLKTWNTFLWDVWFYT